MKKTYSTPSTTQHGNAATMTLGAGAHLTEGSSKLV